MADLSEENRPGQTPQIEVRGSEHPPTAPSQKQKDKSVAKQYDPFPVPLLASIMRERD